VAIDEKFDALIITKNRLILLSGNPSAESWGKQTRLILPTKKSPLAKGEKQEDSPTAE